MSVQKRLDMIVGPNDERHHDRVGISSLEREAIAVRQFILVALRNTSLRSTLSRWLNVPLNLQKNLARPLVVLARRAAETIQVL
jgi:hypothetical protein